MLIRSAIFVKSASKLAECTVSDLPEFAMIGRSNVGKSSLINTIANNSKLSKISIKPGKTTLINFFLINKEWHLVDLPGYGFAKSGTAHRVTWIDTTHDYFVGRSNLKKVFVLIDGSIALQKIDLEFVVSLDQEKIPYAIVLTKLDKSNQKEAARHQRELLEQLSVSVSVILEIFAVSNKTKRGREVLLDYIGEMLGER